MGKRLLPPTPFGQALRKARTAKKLSVREASLLLGITPAALFRWETGTRKPDLNAVADMAEIYCVPVSFFFIGLSPKELRAVPG